jgi:hypothetical protein
MLLLLLHAYANLYIADVAKPQLAWIPAASIS